MHSWLISLVAGEDEARKRLNATATVLYQPPSASVPAAVITLDWPATFSVDFPHKKTAVGAGVRLPRLDLLTLEELCREALGELRRAEQRT